MNIHACHLLMFQLSVLVVRVQPAMELTLMLFQLLEKMLQRVNSFEI